MKPRFSFQRFTALLSLLLFCSALGAGELKTSGIFGDHMVLQRNLDTKAWGTGIKGATVTAEFRGKTATATADKTTGQWSLRIPTGKAGGPFELKLTSGEEIVTFKDVLVGDVWVCSGQSNMEAGLGRGASKAVGMENKIRFFIVKNCGLLVKEDQADTNSDVTVQTPWTPASKKTAGQFSNVGFHFGKKLSDELNVPIGLISCDVGGSKVEAWMSRAELRKTPEGAAELKLFLDNAAKGVRSRWIAQWDTCLCEGMLRPIIGYGIRGATWYQGESNRQNGQHYRDRFGRMITEWRTRWGVGDFPFYYVQIAPFGYKPHELFGASLVRQAQREGLRAYKNVGMAVTADIGNWRSVHPGHKDKVGERLALWALAKTYGKTDLVYSGPLYTGVKFDANKAVIAFEFAEGLAIKGDGIRGLYIAGADKVFHKATATIAGKMLIVTSDNVAKPVAVRYGWGIEASDYPLNLYNGSDLPAAPFRTDNWPAPKIAPAPIVKKIAPAPAALADTIRIACVGDSITFGAGVRDRAKNSYPAQLQALLGKGCTVQNFGISARTLLKKGDRPYWKERIYKNALAFNPHFVIIKLGTNDIKPGNWKHKGEFAADLKALVTSFQTLPSKPAVLVAYPVPVQKPRWGMTEQNITEGVMPYVKQVAADMKLGIVDFHAAVPADKKYFADGIHPNADGAKLMAGEAFKALKAKGIKAKPAATKTENSALIPKPKLERDFYDWYKRCAEIKTLTKSMKTVDLVFIGDSITHMWGGLPKSRIARGTATWDTYYAKRNTVNMGFGWDRIQNVLYRLGDGAFDGITPKVVVLMIGTNNLSQTPRARSNTPAEIAEGIEAVCTKIHTLSPKTKILLQAILPRKFEADHPWRKQIRETNVLLKPLGQKDYITCIDFGAKFLNPDKTLRKELMKDGVHPNAAGYALWAKTIEPTLAKLLGDTAIAPSDPLAKHGPSRDGITRVLCFGDSITQGTYVDGKYTGKVNWVRELQTLAGKTYQAINVGRSGRVTGDTRGLEAGLLKASQVDHALIFLGVNDLRKSTDEVRQNCSKNVAAHIARLRTVYGKSLKITILSSPGLEIGNVAKRFYSKGYNEKEQVQLDKLRADYKALAAKEGCEFLDLWGVVTKGNFTDGLHPNTAGQTQIAAVVWKHLQTVAAKATK